MPFMRLKENHPAFKAMQEVFAKMDEVGIQIEIGAYGQPLIIFDGKIYGMLDIEDSTEYSSYPGHLISMLPPTTEYKLVYEIDDEN